MEERLVLEILKPLIEFVRPYFVTIPKDVHQFKKERMLGQVLDECKCTLEPSVRPSVLLRIRKVNSSRGCKQDVVLVLWEC